MKTARENTQALFDQQPAERVGLVDSPWGATVSKWVAQGYPTEKATRKVKKTVVDDGREMEREIEEEFDQPVPPFRHLGFDMIGAGGWYDMMATATVSGGHPRRPTSGA